MKKFVFGKKGSALVIEMTLLLPFIIIILGILLIFSIYASSFLSGYIHAQQTAILISNDIENPGYISLFDVGDVQINSKRTQLALNEEKKINDYYKNRSIYANSFNKNEDKTNISKALKDNIEKSLVSKRDTFETNIEVKNYLTEAKIVVKVKKNVFGIKMFQKMGLPMPDFIEMKSTAIAKAVRPKTFIDNVDFSAEIINEYIGSNNCLDENGRLKIKIFRDKIKEILKKVL